MYCIILTPNDYQFNPENFDDRKKLFTNLDTNKCKVFANNKIEKQNFLYELIKDENFLRLNREKWQPIETGNALKEKNGKISVDVVKHTNQIKLSCIGCSGSKTRE